MKQEDQKLAVLIQDVPGWLLECQNLKKEDLIVLLAPVAYPVSEDYTDRRDPFEHLGRFIESRHSKVAHVPYIRRIGLTSTHLGFMQRAKLIIFCILPHDDRSLQLELTDRLFQFGNFKPIIVVQICNYIELNLDIPVPTVIKALGYVPSTLKAVADLMFADNGEGLNDSVPVSSIPAGTNIKLWTVEQMYEARDMTSIMTLWEECTSGNFPIKFETFSALLRRPGYAKHYVVRNSPGGEVLGFCATYLSFIDQDAKKVLASLAAILVRPSYQDKGIGFCLHEHVIKQLKKIPYVTQFQLGSNFPRIFRGLPCTMKKNQKWFQNRGWKLVTKQSGQSQNPIDLLLKFENWSIQNRCQTEDSLLFRRCTHFDMKQVLELVRKSDCTHKQTGCYSQYLTLENGPHVGDIILAIEGNNIIATAIKYTSKSGTQVALNLPWAAVIGDHVAGMTCVCLDVDNASKKKIEIWKGFLQFCVSEFQSLGLKELFLDAVVDDVDDLLQMGNVTEFFVFNQS
ncbi:unnamed protein product [Blumeria hordei]|uniref:N-acetyltransferase domain-containing protein n=1 Tax=Blumeria hordei TaxID=2867405 RepID=A0A383UXF6_BLUHO|nr:unnamed protein product [Blumeria hordei]